MEMTTHTLSRCLRIPQIALLLWLAGAACAEEITPLKPGLHELKLDAAGLSWTYSLHLPPQAEKGQALPLVLVLHGAGGDGARYLTKNHWQSKADEAGFIALAPDGQPPRPDAKANFFTNPRLWNSGDILKRNPRARIDDVAFFKALLERVCKQAPVDSKRIYVTGHSNGAGMTFRLVAEMSEIFAAAAPVAGHAWLDENAPPAKSPMPALFIIGTKDPLIPLLGGERQLTWGKSTVPPVDTTLKKWAQTLGCPFEPKILSDEGGLKTVEYGPGSEGVALRVVYIEGQGHGWPGGQESGLRASQIGPSVSTYNATERIWEFFSKQLKKDRAP